MIPGVLLWLGMAFGTLFGMPVVPFYLAAGALWKDWALFLTALALITHFALSFLLAKSILRPFLLRLTERFSKKVTLPKVNDSILVVFIRLFPGLPLFAKSYLLCLSGVGFWTYLIGSLVVEMFWAAGFIFLGQAVMSGKISLIIGAVALIIFIALLLRAYGSRTKKRISQG
jgi:uncharacterized membrane protein YdjX (TVP38/TMEM64 family)